MDGPGCRKRTSIITVLMCALTITAESALTRLFYIRTCDVSERHALMHAFPYPWRRWIAISCSWYAYTPCSSVHVHPPTRSGVSSSSSGFRCYHHYYYYCYYITLRTAVPHEASRCGRKMARRIFLSFCAHVLHKCYPREPTETRERGRIEDTIIILIIMCVIT